MSEKRDISLNALAQQLGMSPEALRRLGDELFEGAQSVADVGDALGLSVSAVFSEEQINDLPEAIQGFVRDREAKRRDLRTQIVACIKSETGESTPADVDALADAAISAWEWEAEMQDEPPRLRTELQRLLKAHYDLGEEIHSAVDTEFGGDDEPFDDADDL